MNTAMAHPMTESPQERLAAILDSHQPSSIVTVTLNPIPVVSQGCKDQHCNLVEIQEQDPFAALDDIERVDMAIVADQLEYMSQRDGEALMGLLGSFLNPAVIVALWIIGASLILGMGVLGLLASRFMTVGLC